MNRQQLVREVAARTGMFEYVVDRALVAAMDVIVREVADGESVKLTGFGTFEAVQGAPRTARNPRTNEPVQVLAKIRPRFSPAEKFDSLVAGDGRVWPTAARKAHGHDKGEV